MHIDIVMNSDTVNSDVPDIVINFDTVNFNIRSELNVARFKMQTLMGKLNFAIVMINELCYSDKL